MFGICWSFSLHLMTLRTKMQFPEVDIFVQFFHGSIPGDSGAGLLEGVQLITGQS